MTTENDGEAETTIETEVAFVLPALAYESIDTEAPGAIEVMELPPAEPEITQAAFASFSTSILAKLDGLQSQFDREVRAEATRERMVDRLHAELQESKNGLLLGILRPVFVDLIQLHDDIGKMVESTQSSEGEVARLLDLMRGFQQGVVDILYRQGVEPFQVDGDGFDPRRQRAVATLPTEDADLNKRVAGRHRPGFTAGDKIIRPEVVTVYAVKK